MWLLERGDIMQIFKPFFKSFHCSTWIRSEDGCVNGAGCMGWLGSFSAGWARSTMGSPSVISAAGTQSPSATARSLHPAPLFSTDVYFKKAWCLEDRCSRLSENKPHQKILSLGTQKSEASTFPAACPFLKSVPFPILFCPEVLLCSF